MVPKADHKLLFLTYCTSVSLVLHVAHAGRLNHVSGSKSKEQFQKRQGAFTPPATKDRAITDLFHRIKERLNL